MEVHENGLTFEIHLNGSDDTGLALAARVLRQKIRELAAGKRVLCIEATLRGSGGAGAEAVAAAAGGCESVTCVNAERADVTWAERKTTSAIIRMRDIRWSSRSVAKTFSATW